MSKIYNNKVIEKLQNFVDNNSELKEFVFNKHINIYADIICVKYIDGKIIKVIPEDITKSYTSVWNNSVLKKFVDDIKNSNLSGKYFYVYDNENYYLLRKVDKTEFKAINKLNGLDIKFVDNFYSIISISKDELFNNATQIVRGTEVKNIVKEEENDIDELYTNNKKDEDILISNSLFDDFD